VPITEPETGVPAAAVPATAAATTAPSIPTVLIRLHGRAISTFFVEVRFHPDRRSILGLLSTATAASVVVDKRYRGQLKWR
jgi:hypothetical protein